MSSDLATDLMSCARIREVCRDLGINSSAALAEFVNNEDVSLACCSVILFAEETDVAQEWALRAVTDALLAELARREAAPK